MKGRDGGINREEVVVSSIWDGVSTTGATTISFRYGFAPRKDLPRNLKFHVLGILGPCSPF